jgi:hypothetical protein
MVCRAAATLSAAGRTLFDRSRERKSIANDADRLRKYLGRFDLEWGSGSAGSPKPDRSVPVARSVCYPAARMALYIVCAVPDRDLAILLRARIKDLVPVRRMLTE